MSIIQINPVTLGGKKFLPPQIDITSNFVDFTSSEFIDSDSQSYSVSSQEIRGNLTIVAPYRFRVSLDGVNWFLSVVIPHSSGVLPSTQVWVKFTQGEQGIFIKNIIHYTDGNSIGVQVTGICS